MSQIHQFCHKLDFGDATKDCIKAKWQQVCAIFCQLGLGHYRVLEVELPAVVLYCMELTGQAYFAVDLCALELVPNMRVPLIQNCKYKLVELLKWPYPDPKVMITGHVKRWIRFCSLSQNVLRRGLELLEFVFQPLRQYCSVSAMGLTNY